MARFMVRKGTSDFQAFQIATAMEEAGANVFSITYDGQYKELGMELPRSRFCVWAKIESDAQIDGIDKAIDHALYPEKADNRPENIGVFDCVGDHIKHHAELHVD